MPLRRVLMALALLAWSLVAVAAHAVEGPPPPPRRIVSLNLCTDQLVLALADRDAVRSVTWLARDPQSAVMAAAAAEVPINHGLAEEIIPFAPDLVVAGIYTARTTVALLKRFGLPVLELDVPQSLPAIAAQIRTVAHALGHPERGEAMVATMMADLTALGPVPAGPWPVAVVYHPNGFTGGPGSLIDDLLTRAGLRNLAPVRQALDDVLHGRTTLASLVLLEIRLPRALLGVLVGMSLGLAGAAMQGLLRNPLAEPGVVGVSGGAAFGAVLAFYTGLSVAVPLALPLGGIAGALLAVALLALLTGRQASTLTLILAGVALNSLAGALTALALNLAPNPYAAVEIIFWLMGSLADRSLHHVLSVLPLMLGGWGLLLRTAQALDGLTLGEDTARSLGVRLGRLQLQLVVGTALAVGARSP